MTKQLKPIYYKDYLKLDQLLSSQSLESTIHGTEAHDELLFIIVHQAYELWFKQILHELCSIQKFFAGPSISDREISLSIARLERIKKIQNLFLGQFDILESMTPMDFLEFRNFLIPASGFQSIQFREIEIRLGLKIGQRKKIKSEYFLGRLREEDRQKLLNLEKEKSFLELIEIWLERMPYHSSKSFQFWIAYQDEVVKMLKEDKKTIEQNHANFRRARKEC